MIKIINSLISIVVPVYNVEQYIDKCIDSIINQTYKNIEIILVDDGSTDNSGTLCDNYAQKDKRIKVVHKSNGGLSDARNVGILESKGEYIFFVDSDDSIEHNTISNLTAVLKNEDYDIICGNGIRCFSNGQKKKIIKIDCESDFSGLDYICKRILTKSYYPAVWLNLYSSKLIKENKIFFKKGRLHEDEEWTPRIFIKAKKVKFIDSINYNYLIRENSITNKKDKTKNALDIIETCYELEQYFINQIHNVKKLSILNSYLGYLYLGGINMGKLYRKPYKNRIRKLFIIGKTSGFKDKFKAYLFLINIRLYCFINKCSKYEINNK